MKFSKIFYISNNALFYYSGYHLINCDRGYVSWLTLLENVISLIKIMFYLALKIFLLSGKLLYFTNLAFTIMYITELENVSKFMCDA